MVLLALLFVDPSPLERLPSSQSRKHNDKMAGCVDDLDHGGGGGDDDDGHENDDDGDEYDDNGLDNCDDGDDAGVPVHCRQWSWFPSNKKNQPQSAL